MNPSSRLTCTHWCTVGCEVPSWDHQPASFTSCQSSHFYTTKKTRKHVFGCSKQICMLHLRNHNCRKKGKRNHMLECQFQLPWLSVPHVVEVQTGTQSLTCHVLSISLIKVLCFSVPCSCCKFEYLLPPFYDFSSIQFKWMCS